MSNKKSKNPIIAALLNIIPGLGYLYLGQRIEFALLLILNFLFTIPILGDLQSINVSQEVWWWLSSVSFIVAFPVDAYLLAKRN